MKKIISAFVALFVLVSVNAQVNRSLQPVSSLISSDILTPLEERILPVFDMEAAKKLDLLEEQKNEMPKFSRSIFINITFKNSGSWTYLPDGSRVWRLKVTSTGAQALLPYFNKFYLPKGAMLHVYTPDKDEVIGAFTYENNQTDGYYATGLIHGETLVMEYFEPKEEIGKGEICLNEVGHAYRWVESYFPKRHKAGVSPLDFGSSDVCEVNINCTEGTDWQDEKRAVVCVIVQSNTGQGSCSGTMINNVRQDCTPYLLSAQHCSEGTAANQYAQWLFYYNFEAPSCVTPAAIGHIGDYFVTGCTKKADSNDNGGDTGSDFLLLQLTHVPPDSFHIYYAGWNNANTAADSGVCIHHPYTDIKKISTFKKKLVSDTWFNVAGTHWRVQWAGTVNGHGVTEEGSSGSAIFNTQRQVIGTLTGGDSYCTDPTANDYFGKVAYHWTSNGAAKALQLKPWLDPDSIGVTSLNGREANCGINSVESIKEEAFFQLFPNPTNGLVELHFLNSDAERNVSVFDVTGRQLSFQKATALSFTIDLSKENKGVYIVTVVGKQSRTIRKLVLQ